MIIMLKTASGAHLQLSSGELIFVKNETNPKPSVVIKTEKEFYEYAPEFKNCLCAYIDIENPETEYARLVNKHYVIKEPGLPFRYEEKLSEDEETKYKQVLKRIGKEA